jgi:TadE-like protein
VELMLVLPILLLLLYGVIEVARLVFIYSSVANASRQAARYGATAGDGNGTPRYQDCEGIRDVANRSAIIVDFDDINITYDRGINSDGSQVPISGIDPNPNKDSCPIDHYDVRNGDRIIVQISATYQPILTILPIDPMEIVSSSARTFIVSIPILGSALPTGFKAETSTPSRTASPTLEITTPTSTFTPISTHPITITVPLNTLPPAITNTPARPQPPTKIPTVTPTAINCSGLTGVSHGPLVIKKDYIEMAIQNNTGFVLSTSQIYAEWNHDTGHKGSDKTLHMRQVSLQTSYWNGDVYAPSTFFSGFYPTIPTGESLIHFVFNQSYDIADGTERILITISTPGCVNYPIDSRN